MTLNEKVILTLLSKDGPLSKRELAAQGKMGWATVVKMTNRLQENGFIKKAGTVQKEKTSGKNADSFDITGTMPLAVGIDIEYDETNISLVNLKNNVLKHKKYVTPVHPAIEELEKFIIHIFYDLLRELKIDKDMIHGIGLGMPLWLIRENEAVFHRIEVNLEKKLAMKVRVENNISCYTMFKKWGNHNFNIKNFILIAIRIGIGVGIIVKGNLFTGEHRLAGQLGHIKIKNDGPVCHCGKKGCLETFVNLDTLYHSYLNEVLGEPISAAENLIGTGFINKLADFFTAVKNGNEKAIEIIKRNAKYLAFGISTLLNILDISTIFISGEFGKDGDVIINYLNDEIAENIFPNIKYNLKYQALDNLDYTRGSALLILNDFLTEIEQS